MSRIATDGIDYTSRDYESFRQLMLSQLSILMPEYTDHSQTDAGIVILELFAKGLDVISYYLDAIANETLLPTCKRLSSAEVWCNILSYTPRYATPSRIMQVFKLTAAQTSDYVIPAGTRIKTQGSVTEPEVIFETVEDLTIPSGNLGNETNQDGNYKYSVEAVQGVTVNGELVGSSDGSANQTFELHYSPVIMNDVEIWINEGAGFELWTKVDRFVDSGSTSKHYMLRRASDNSTIVVFGDGTLGKIPAVFDDGIYANYRVGGGTVGNVGAMTVNVLDTNLALVDETYNPDEAFEKGFDDETLEEIKANAPRHSELKWGALTLQDFSDVVLLNFNHVLLATSVRDTEDIDSIHIYMLTDTMTEEDTTIDEELYNELTEFFAENGDGRKIVGANNIFLEPPVLRGIDLEATLVVHDRYSRSAVKEKVEELLKDGFKLGNYSFNQELSLSDVQAYVLTSGIEGIKAFYFTSPTEQVITPANNEIFVLGELNTTVMGGVE